MHGVSLPFKIQEKKKPIHKEFRGGGVLRAPKILYALILCVFYLLLKKGYKSKWQDLETFKLVSFGAPAILVHIRVVLLAPTRVSKPMLFSPWPVLGTFQTSNLGAQAIVVHVWVFPNNIRFVRGLLGTGLPDPTLESTSPSPPQGSIWHRFNIDSTSK